MWRRVNIWGVEMYLNSDYAEVLDRHYSIKSEEVMPYYFWLGAEADGWH